MTALQALLSSDSPDWCTPPEVLEPVRAFAAIRFDPFSNSGSIVGAVENVSPPEDSLDRPWPLDGLIWCNPPFGRQLAACAAKIRDEANRGCEILTLVPARTDTRWWAELGPQRWCAWRGRITFLEQEEAWRARMLATAKRQGRPCDPSELQPRIRHSATLVANESAPFPAALCYHGWRPAEFSRHFAPWGTVYLAPGQQPSRGRGRPQASRPAVQSVEEHMRQGRSIRQIAALLGVPKNRIELVRKSIDLRTPEPSEQQKAGFDE